MEKTKFQVIDNIFPQKIHQKICHGILNPQFDWNYCPSVISRQGEGAGYFMHLFLYTLRGDNVICPKYELIRPIIDYLQPTILFRAKANLYTQSKGEKEPKAHGYHVDYWFPHIAAIYYLNTNNGFTILNDGIKIRSIANRLLIFEGHISHSSTDCTDEPFRANINFNYIKPDGVSFSSKIKPDKNNLNSKVY